MAIERVYSHQEGVFNLQWISSVAFLGALCCAILGIKLKWFRAQMNFGGNDAESQAVQPRIGVYRSYGVEVFNPSYRIYDNEPGPSQIRPISAPPIVVSANNEKLTRPKDRKDEVKIIASSENVSVIRPQSDISQAVRPVRNEPPRQNESAGTAVIQNLQNVPADKNMVQQNWAQAKEVPAAQGQSAPDTGKRPRTKEEKQIQISKKRERELRARQEKKMREAERKMRQKEQKQEKLRMEKEKKLRVEQEKKEKKEREKEAKGEKNKKDNKKNGGQVAPSGGQESGPSLVQATQGIEPVPAVRTRPTNNPLGMPGNEYEPVSGWDMVTVHRRDLQKDSRPKTVVDDVNLRNVTPQNDEEYNAVNSLYSPNYDIPKDPIPVMTTFGRPSDTSKTSEKYSDTEA